MSDPKVEVALPAANGLKGETEVDNNGAVIADEDTKSSMDEDSNSAKSQKINSPSLVSWFDKMNRYLVHFYH